MKLSKEPALKIKVLSLMEQFPRDISSPPPPPPSSTPSSLPLSFVDEKDENVSVLLSTSLFSLGGVREIAVQITKVMWEMFRAVGPSELYDGVWQGKKRELFAPNISKLGEQFNWLSALCAVDVLNCHDEEERLAVLIKVIELAWRLKKMRNYEGMAAVGTIFNWASIQRLKPLWAAIPKKILTKKEEIEHLLDPSNNYESMTKHISHHHNEPYLPFLAPKLRELRYLYDSSSKKNEDGTIDLLFLMKIGSVIHEVLLPKQNNLQIPLMLENEALCSVLKSKLELNTDQMEDILYQKSKMIFFANQTTNNPIHGLNFDYNNPSPPRRRRKRARSAEQSEKSTIILSASLNSPTAIPRTSTTPTRGPISPTRGPISPTRGPVSPTRGSMTPTRTTTTTTTTPTTPTTTPTTPTGTTATATLICPEVM